MTNEELKKVLKGKKYIIEIMQYLLKNNYNFTSEVNDEEAAIEVYNICKLYFYFDYKKGLDYKLTKYINL